MKKKKFPSCNKFSAFSFQKNINNKEWSGQEKSTQINNTTSHPDGQTIQYEFQVALSLGSMITPRSRAAEGREHSREYINQLISTTFKYINTISWIALISTINTCRYKKFVSPLYTQQNKEQVKTYRSANDTSTSFS